MRMHRHHLMSKTLKFHCAFTDILFSRDYEVSTLQLQVLIIRPVTLKKSGGKSRALRIARIARQIHEGTYYVPGRDIAAKLILQEAVYCCLT